MIHLDQTVALAARGCNMAFTHFKKSIHLMITAYPSMPTLLTFEPIIEHILDDPHFTTFQAHFEDGVNVDVDVVNYVEEMPQVYRCIMEDIVFDYFHIIEEYG